MPPTPNHVPRRRPAPASFRDRFQAAARGRLLDGQTRTVALALASLAGPGGTIPEERQPSNGDLRLATGLRRGDIRRLLADLETDGWINRSYPVAGDQFLRHITLTIPTTPETPAP
jgi:DNA-binding MarR family transcriptional regulator